MCVPYLKELLGELLVHDLLGRVLLGRRGEEAAEDGVDAALLHQSPGTAGFRFDGHQLSLFALCTYYDLRITICSNLDFPRTFESSTRLNRIKPTET